MEENFLSNLLGSFGIFPSKEKLEKREAYQNEMFPFGDEEKRLVTHHLQRVNRTYPVNKTMFLFLIIKEEYQKAEREGLEPVQCAERARVRSCKQHVLPQEELPYLFSYAMLETRIPSLEDMPDVDRVLQLQSRLFPDGYDAPDWSALPERNQNDG